MKKKNVLIITAVLSSLAFVVANNCFAEEKNVVEVSRHTPLFANSNATSTAFVTPGNTNTTVDYVSEGIKISSSEGWSTTKLGQFDVTHGIDVKFIVPQTASNGTDVTTGSYVEMVLANVTNPDYKVAYRIWVDFVSNDRPTNVYIYNNGVKDIPDTGWISRNVDGVPNQYHMAYNVDETLVGERLAGMQKVDNAENDLISFFNNAPSKMFTLGFDYGCWNTKDGNYEIIVTEVNGQSFKNTNGTLNKVNDAFLYVGKVAESVAVNDTVEISAYAKDIFNDTSIEMVVTKPDSTTENISIENGKVDYTFSALGTYNFKVSTTGSNGNEVSKEFTVISRSANNELSISVSGYETFYDINEEISIIAATYSDNVVESSIVVTKPNGDKVTVNANDTFKFEKPGIYTITYTAKDDALPIANEKSETITINIPDLIKPVVNIADIANASVNSEFTPTITITDDSEYDVTVTLEKPDKTIVKLFGTNNYKFTPETEGEYTLKVVVEDIYGNSEIATETFTVSKQQSNTNTNNNTNTGSNKKGCKGSASTSIISLIAIAGALLLKKKNK